VRHTESRSPYLGGVIGMIVVNFVVLKLATR
jgi:hypothetical protein